MNGVGGFAADGQEYVIRLEPRADGTLVLPPRPWCNVLANERFGCLVSETGATTTWSGNSREHRLTPWSNDPVLDPHGEALYLRDEDSGAFWSPLPGPAPRGGRYETRHGFGYTTFRTAAGASRSRRRCSSRGGDPVRIARVTVVNRGAEPRRLVALPLAAAGAGHDPPRSPPRRSGSSATTTPSPCWPEPGAGSGNGAVAFATVVARGGRARPPPRRRRAAFLGDGDVSAPRAVRRGGPLDAAVADGVRAGLAQQIVLEVPPGGAVDLRLPARRGRGRTTRR